MASYMYNPSKKITEILAKFLEFDPEQLHLGIWSGDLTLTNVNLRSDVVYSKINRMKKSPSGRDPLKLKLLEGTIGFLRIQIPWKSLVWGQGDVFIDIKGVNAIVGFESLDETEARREKDKHNGNPKGNKDEKEDDTPKQSSRKYRDAKQKILARAEDRLMEGEHLAGWLAHVIKNELKNVDIDDGKEADQKISKGFEKILKKASSNFVWRFLAGLRVNIEGFKLVVVQDNIEIGLTMPSTQVHSGDRNDNGINDKNITSRDDAADDKSRTGPVPEPSSFEDALLGNTIDKKIEASGVSISLRRQPLLPATGIPHPHCMALLPNDYILRPIDIHFSFNFFHPHEDQKQKRKIEEENGSPDNTSNGDSAASSKRRRGKRDKRPLGQDASRDGTAETDIGSSLALESHAMQQRQQSALTMDSGDGPPSIRPLSQMMSNEFMPRVQRRRQPLYRSAPLVRPDDLGSVYASVMAESVQLTPKLALSMECGEVRLLCSSQHLCAMHAFLAVGARMRNGRPTCTIAEVLAKGEKATHKRGNYSGTASSDGMAMPALARTRTVESGEKIRSEFGNRRMSMGIRNELAAKSRNKRKEVVRSWWHYAYGVVAYDIQKRKRRRDTFRDKYVSFDWERQKQKRKEYVNLYLALRLDVERLVDCGASTQALEAEELMKIEDELPIEQILLYRSIARAIFQHGIKTMPQSLEILYEDYASDMKTDQRRASVKSNEENVGMIKKRRMSMFHDTRQDERTDEDEKVNLFSSISRRCHNGRKIRSHLAQDNVKLFEDPADAQAKRQLMPENNFQVQLNECDQPGSQVIGTIDSSGAAAEMLDDSKISFSNNYSAGKEPEPKKSMPARASKSRRKTDMADGGRTVRTMKTTKSAIAGTVVETIVGADRIGEGGAKLSISLVFKSVELMLVDDDNKAPAMARQKSRISDSSGSSDDVSELSFLSEEEFFREQESAPAAVVEEEDEENRMLSSTDFLLFGLPKDMLLHITLAPLRCTYLGRAGGSRNINFTVGSISAIGGGESIIAIGSRASPTPVPMVSLSRNKSGSSHDRFRFNSQSAKIPKEAVRFSVVAHEDQKVLQADILKVHVCLNFSLVSKLLEFPEKAASEGSPQRTLPKSHNEEARMFLLNENSPSKLAELNASIRIHGCEVSIPVESMESTMNAMDSSNLSNAVAFDQNNSPAARISARLIEMYSGAAVNDLCGTENTAPQVGSLAMLDVAELVASRGNLSSHHSVMAVSGVDFALNTETDAFAFSKAPSLLAEPLDLEILLTTNSSTLIEEDCPRQEVVVEVSPIHALLSETRLMLCSRVIERWKSTPQTKSDVSQDNKADEGMPPRLEALSRLIMRCVDVAIRSVRISLLSDDQKQPLTREQKELVVEECLGDFLSVASCFDLKFPNDDALSSAMQICIDRLCGLGHNDYDAGDCANAALLNFLEDEAHTEKKEAEASAGGGQSSDFVDRAIKNAVDRALEEYPPPEDEVDPEQQPANILLLIDFPSGATVSTIELYYDFHLAASLSSMFVSNAAGVCVLRLTSDETSYEQTEGFVEQQRASESSEPALVFSRFVLDADYAFGKGGLPLSILGSDEVSGENSGTRIRERQDDVQIGDLEYLFSHKTYVDMMETISSLNNCLTSQNLVGETDQSKQEEENIQGATAKTSLLIKGDFVSVLLASDELVPFARLRFEDMYLKQDGKPVEANASHVPLMRLVSRNFALMNLGEEGQFYPDSITLLYNEEIEEFPFQFDFIKNLPPHQVGSEMNLVLRGFRVFLLRQFINELLQYLLNESHGIGKLKHAAKVASEEAEKAGLSPMSTTPPLAYKIHILDSSLILPRSSKSHDMAVIELTKGLISNSRHLNSFRMPTENLPFQSERDHEEADKVKDLFTRMKFQLHEMRIFSSLGEGKSCHKQSESPIFRFFYDIGRRAKNDGWVYNKLPGLLYGPPDDLGQAFDALSRRRWKEITTDDFSLDIFVDYSPNLRLLISEPLDSEDYIPAPRLDVRLSQFCMLVSIWYDNMQELPVLFPYSATQFMGGRDLGFGTVPVEYGTDEYMIIWDDWSCVKTEICILLRNLSMRCTFDPTGYFEEEPEIKPFYDDPRDPLVANSVQVHFTDVVVHTYSDLRGRMRVACAAAGFDLIDERRSNHCQHTFSVSKKNAGLDGDNEKFTTWGDLNWGLHSNIRDIDKTLPQPFQLSCFMTKDWALINLGLEKANGVLIELSPIWFFLGFFVSYWQDPAYGNPGYIGNEKARVIKNKLGGSRKVDLKDPEGMNIDFRLWLSTPHLVIPCDLVDPRAPSLRIESETGLWYRFRKINDYKMQEVVSTSLDMVFSNEFLQPRQSFDSRDRMVRHLVEGLSFGLRLDGNDVANHADYALQIPYDMNTRADCSIRSHELNVMPMILDAPTICSPIETPTRFLGPRVCEITLIVEVLPLTSSVMVNFFKGPVDENIQPQQEDEAEPGTFSFSGDISDLRLFAVDPVLGVQLPVAVLSISAIKVTASQLSNGLHLHKREVSRGESIPEDLQVTLDCHLWGDYFKLGVTRSWEPLLEPYKCRLLYEKSKHRGQGMSLNADCPLHLNLSGALLLIVDEVFDSFTRMIKEVFGQEDTEMERVAPRSSHLRDRITVGERVRLRGDRHLAVIHDIPKPLQGDRVAFAFCNLTGQKVRIHQQQNFDRISGLKPAIVTYLNHDESTSLSLDATISVVKNLSVVEVPYPGLPNSQSMRRAKRASKHAVDIQIPGFKWVQGIKVDTFGRKFESLQPRSPDVLGKVNQDWRLDNAMQLLVEVGLDNGGRLVTVRSLFEVRNNTTHPLSVLLHPNPQHNPENSSAEAGSTAVDAVSVVPPGEFCQIPTMLLEGSLHMGGCHLGSLWLKPASYGDISIPSLTPVVGHEGAGETDFETRFCSRPVQLAKLVAESAELFAEHGKTEIAPEKAKTGVQIACGVKSKSGEQLAPFCYAVEVGRSPIVPEKRNTSLIGGTNRYEYPEVHAPVSYTLSIHAPYVITNLLPETGRFELMHAIRRTVLWYGDLKPGQSMPVHSVGLDAPLLLLLNLGFCRTPVGEGALVHHGADFVATNKDGLGLKQLVGKSAGAVGKAVTKSTGAVGKAATKGAGAVGKVTMKGAGVVGKVVTKRTKQIGKTFISISDSPEKRRTLLEDADPHEMALIDAELEQQQQLMNQTMSAQTLGFDEGLNNMNSPDGKVHAVETHVYSPNDVAAETAVVDSIGQRLTLNIENIRGGGGQRRIGIYCPFWIINTTQHSLRYKQEGSKSFVCGSVLDHERDGSKPVDGSTRNYVNRHQLARANRINSARHLRSQRPMNEGTIFAGTPGALATSPGRCDLPPKDLTDLIDKDLPLDKMSNLAFMFNFHEDVLSIGNRRLTLQLAEETENVQYYSDWSRGFSLDSVGFSQIVALHCKEGRALELSVVVSVAPGFLSGYTKIVRIVPRYVLVNRLELPVRLWQDSSVFRTLNEDRTSTGFDEVMRGNVEKWRFAADEGEQLSAINEYEALWGRITLIDEAERESSLEGTTAHRNASYITTARSMEFVPFHLPDSRGERQLRIGLGGAWNLTASFASDFPGDHSLKLNRAVDIRFLRHVSTRASSQYKVTLPPAQTSGHEWDGELGIWFETDWGGDRRIIVKGMKRGRYCFNETDIHAGDELLRIDNVSVARMSFAETMKLLKQRVTQVAIAATNASRPGLKDTSKVMSSSSNWISLRRRMSESETDNTSYVLSDRLVLTFRTLEERLRRLRMKAAKHSGIHAGKLGSCLGAADTASQASEQIDNAADLTFNGVRVEMKPLHHSMFVVLKRQDPENPPFRIENRSMNHTIFYRQRGCESHPWNHLKPGQSEAYSWEEPMRQKRLAIRASRDGLFLSRTESEGAEESDGGSTRSDTAGRDLEHRAARSATMRQILTFHQYIEDEEQGRFGTATIVKLEEIGFRGVLSCPVSPNNDSDSRKTRLNVEVETDGATRILVVSDEIIRDDEVSIMNKRMEALKRQMREEEGRVDNLKALRYLLLSSTGGMQAVEGNALSKVPYFAPQIADLEPHEKVAAVDELAKNITDDFPEDSTIHSRHQVVIEVLEAVGLNPDNEIGTCNPYCEVLLKGRSKLKKSFFESKKNRGKTYYQKKTLSPKWMDQIFVFDVPSEAVSVTRGHSIHVRLRNFRFVGAHKLMGQTIIHLHSVRNQEELVGWYPLAGRSGGTELGRGSVKLRIQWIHSTPALLDYFIMVTERRLLQLRERRQGLREQWKLASDAEKRKKDRDLTKPTLSQNARKVSKEKSSSKRLAQQQRELEGKHNDLSMLHIARDRTKLVKNFLNYSKKKRSRTGEDEPGDEDPNFKFEANAWVGNSRELPRITEDESGISSSSSSGSGDSDDTSLFEVTSRGDSLEDYGFSDGRNVDVNRSPSKKQFQYRKPTKIKLRPQKPRSFSENRKSEPDRAFVRKSGRLFANKLLKKLSQRNLMSTKEEPKEVNDSDSSSLENERKAATSKRFNEEIISELLKNGFLFHDVGRCFHRIDPYGFHCKTDAGESVLVPRLKNWTAAQALFNDETLDVSITGEAYELVINNSVTVPRAMIDSGGSFSKKVAREKLELPPLAPLSMAQRSLQHVEYLVQARNQFERASRRTLRSVLNPGGWLTIRPITALNLPDTYTGMHVKLRYGPEVVVSSSVDARVSPTWTPKEVMSRINTSTENDEVDWGLPNVDRQGEVPPALNMDRFEFYENDLLFYVEPQKTSGSIRLSVVGERLNNKSELGVLHIPLGAAIGSCIDCIEDYLDTSADFAPSATPMYTRWFPLMNPKDTDPVEGDLGLSARPPESEKLGDDEFQEYFAPCIQLALMWWPDDKGLDFESKEEQADESHLMDGSLSHRPTGPSNTGETDSKSLTNNYFNADIGRISLALIDSERAKELLSFSALDIDVRYSVTEAKTRMGLVIGWVQLDHQEDKSREPVVLAPKPVEHVQPTCQLLVVKDNLRSKKNIVSYEHIRLTVEEIDITIEETWLFDLWDFFVGVVRRREVRQKANVRFAAGKGSDLLTTASRFLDVEPSDPDAPSLYALLIGEDADSDASFGKVYVEQLVLGLLKVNLSYVKGKKQSSEMTEKGDWVTKTFDTNYQTRPQNIEGEEGDPNEMFTRWSQHTNDEDLWAERKGKRSQNLKGIIGAVLPNVSDAPIRLQGKVLDNVFESPSEILSSITKFYVMETLRQVYKIIGSLDFVGNPTMIFSSFVSGVRDLVVTPSVAFLRSPTNISLVGTAAAKGGLSLFSNTTSGIFGFLAKTTVAAGQATALLTFDPEYREWHRERVVTEATNLNREWKKRGVESISSMMLKPVGDITMGIAFGVSGVFTAPYKGFRSSGSLGLVRGVAVGGIGLIAKPLVGILDAFAHFTVSVHDVAKSVNILERRYQPVLKLRLPYIFALNNVLVPFDSVSVRSVYLLKVFPLKKPKDKARANGAPPKEIHIASEVLHMEPGVATYCVVTTLRVVLFKVKREYGGRLGPTLCWQVSLAKGDKVKSQVSDHGHNGVALTITRQYKPTKRHYRKKGQANKSQADKFLELEDLLIDDDCVEEADGDLDTSQNLERGDSVKATKVHWDDDKDDAYHGHGATQDNAGETLEWFTVLAEYPNRPQLTRIHNAISCLSGNFDALMKEQRLSRGLETEGVTTFGPFEFDEDLSDDIKHKNMEKFLMNALDQLPWMHDSAFESSRGKSSEAQRSIVQDLRDQWVFSKELEASITFGGPAWLVEARAHAMFVPSEAPNPSDPLLSSDPIVKEIIHQQQNGSISRGQVLKLFERYSEEQLQLRKLEMLESGRAAAVADEEGEEAAAASDDEFGSTFQDLSMYGDVIKTVVHPGKDRDLRDFLSAHENFSRTMVSPRGLSNESSFDDSDEEFASADESTREHDNLVPAGFEEMARNSGHLQLHFNRQRRPLKQQRPEIRSNNDGASDERIDRMESLMEQLVIFNSQLALMKRPSLVAGRSQRSSLDESNEESPLALQEEISALRYQLEQQATKDEATTGVLKSLKEELASIRAALSQPTEPESTKEKKKRMKKEKKLKKEQKRQEAVVVVGSVENDSAVAPEAKSNNNNKKKKQKRFSRLFLGSGKGRGSKKSAASAEGSKMTLPPGNLLEAQSGEAGGMSEEKIEVTIDEFDDNEKLSPSATSLGMV